MRTAARRLIQALYNIDETYYLNEGKRKLSDTELCVMYALIKRWEKEGYLTMTSIPGKRREMYILLTETGKEYAAGFLGFLYRAQ